ncbi:vanadium-dependent haloperoxidase [Ramlibacter ginsenosidimutans]|uniref:Vanadium-dependent haloperoxidase n=1 Tax=Ramlibacter ginsenosidimutans TaxID=502333 RepID=A0A934TSF9_9BURK|nr:vanadium-dependent haloperoxidase [Ramlibacter ginsenosidimutans]MBK6006594.1 vanadium-dependent haloperoxidase [Ramlibacter ginsenosidimutans]
MKQIRPSPWLSGLLCAAALLPLSAARADVVADWNERAVSAVYAARMTPDMQARTMAMMHIAMFEALNSLQPRYAPYRAVLQVEERADPSAATAVAAHDVLVLVCPEQAKDIDAGLQADLAKVPDGPEKEAGTRLGQRAAAAMLAEREHDGATAPITYRPFTQPGRYVPTTLPQSSTWMGVKPFALKSSDQFRPPPPIALSSARWAADYNEVKHMGAKIGSARSADQNDIANFWQLTGVATYNPLTRHEAVVHKLDLLDSARLFALSSMATADAAIAIFDAKYAYNFWRPITAIRNGDIDGNDATERDATWEPLINTPMHPEYPCAHCTFQGAAAGVLQVLYGDAVPKVTLTSTAAPGITRSYERLSDYVAEVIDGRIYEGVHYRSSGEAGAALGRKVADEVVRTQLVPVH